MLSRADLEAWAKDLFYRWLRLVARSVAILIYRLRVSGREHLPSAGSALILSNHQSMLDPLIVGLICNGRLNYIARKTLFRNRIFAFFIRSLDAIELDQQRGGLGGLKEMLRRLKDGKWVLIFPEGSRSATDQMLDLKLGFVPIARRSKVPLIPVGIFGANRVLSRGTLLPRRSPLAVVVGEPIEPELLAALDDDALKVCLNQKLRSCQLKARKLVENW